jgi:hypothetical protein
LVQVAHLHDPDSADMVQFWFAHLNLPAVGRLVFGSAVHNAHNTLLGSMSTI